jgi:Rieske Fe-S protein
MNKITRRDFLKVINRLLAALGLTAIAAPVLAFFYPPKLEEMPTEPVLVGPEDELPPNQGKVIAFGRYPALVIHTSEGLRAYSAVCTHFACLVKWNPASGMLECPCHEGYFDPRDGSVISGPPPAPLESIRVFIEDGTLFIGGEA